MIFCFCLQNEIDEINERPVLALFAPEMIILLYNIFISPDSMAIAEHANLKSIEL
jgi:hypothetical protein